jgi:predicted nucleotidyltransferase
MQRAEIIDHLTRALTGRPGIVVAYLFGSVARDEARPSSDVDVGVVLEQGPLRDLPALIEYGHLQSDLQELVEPEVDLVVRNDAPPELVYRAIRDGVVLAEKSALERALFELRARNESFDLQPMLELYRRTVLGKA